MRCALIKIINVKSQLIHSFPSIRFTISSRVTRYWHDQMKIIVSLLISFNWRCWYPYTLLTCVSVYICASRAVTHSILDVNGDSSAIYNRWSHKWQIQSALCSALNFISSAWKRACERVYTNGKRDIRSPVQLLLLRLVLTSHLIFINFMMAIKMYQNLVKWEIEKENERAEHNRSSRILMHFHHPRSILSSRFCHTQTANTTLALEKLLMLKNK